MAPVIVPSNDDHFNQVDRKINCIIFDFDNTLLATRQIDEEALDEVSESYICFL